MNTRAPTSLRALLAALGMLAVLVPTAPAPASAAEPEWTIEGSGWGHGVGMSQWGALGMALEGASSREILAHFYSGASLVDLGTRNLPSWWDPPHPVLVGLRQGVDEVTVEAWNGEAELCQDGCADRVEIPSGEQVTVQVTGADRCRVVAGGRRLSTGACDIEVSWDNDGGASRIRVDGEEYAHGSLRVIDDGRGGAHVVLDVAMEQYLRGIAEISGSWPPAAQRAQVVAARNYTIRKVIERGEQGIRSCGCHVRDTVADQVYAGWAKEGIRPNRWVDAVEDTEGVVAVHPSTGLVFTAYYSSSSGGATENNEDVWGGAPVAFLRSVDDPWSVQPDLRNPNSSWARTYTQSELEGMLGLDEVADVQLVRGPPGATVRVWGTDGGSETTRDYRGESLRLRFSLRSPWVSEVISPYGLGDARTSVHAEDIAYIADRGITKGCNPPDNTRFCPDQAVTRGQMAAFVVRALGLGPADGDHFADDDGSVFEDEINRLATAGITRGCGDGDYCPDGPITREQMAAFMRRAFTLVDGGQIDFTDDDTSAFEADIQALATAGVTKGCNPPSNSRFCPEDPVTRGQMASFLARALRAADS